MSKNFAVDCACECEKTCCCWCLFPTFFVDDLYNRKIEPANGKSNNRMAVKILSIFIGTNLLFSLVQGIALDVIYGSAAPIICEQVDDAGNVVGTEICDLPFVKTFVGQSVPCQVPTSTGEVQAGKLVLNAAFDTNKLVCAYVVGILRMIATIVFIALLIKDVFPSRGCCDVACGGAGCCCTTCCLCCTVSKVVKHAEKNLSRVGAPIHAHGYPYNSKAYGSV